MTSETEEHIRILAILHYVLAGMTALMALIPVIHVAIGIFMLTSDFPVPPAIEHAPGPDARPDFAPGNPESHQLDPEGARMMGWLFIVVGGGFVLVGQAAALLIFMTGRRLSRRRSRTFCLVIAAIECLFAPLGTVLGIFTILVLTKPEARVLFGESPPVAAAPAARAEFARGMKWHGEELFTSVPNLGEVILRPLVPADQERVAEAYRQLSAESRLNRFWMQTPELSPRMLERLTNTDGHHHVAWVARLCHESDFVFLGAASYWRLEDDEQTAEIGITIADEWQGQGIGTLLMAMLWWQAWENGIARLIGYARFENERVVQWWRTLGGTIQTTSLQREMTLDLADPKGLIETDGDRGRLEMLVRELADSTPQRP